jgi:hypothetical protein
VIVSSGRPFTSRIEAMSPRRATMLGPGKKPLYAHTFEYCSPPRSTTVGASWSVRLVGETTGGMRSG